MYYNCAVKICFIVIIFTISTSTLSPSLQTFGRHKNSILYASRTALAYVTLQSTKNIDIIGT